MNKETQKKLSYVGKFTDDELKALDGLAKKHKKIVDVMTGKVSVEATVTMTLKMRYQEKQWYPHSSSGDGIIAMDIEAFCSDKDKEILDIEKALQNIAKNLIKTKRVNETLLKSLKWCGVPKKELWNYIYSDIATALLGDYPDLPWPNVDTNVYPDFNFMIPVDEEDGSFEWKKP